VVGGRAVADLAHDAAVIGGGTLVVDPSMTARARLVTRVFDLTGKDRRQRGRSVRTLVSEGVRGKDAPRGHERGCNQSEYRDQANGLLWHYPQLQRSRVKPVGALSICP
jgi:hypothetical protein